MKQQFMNVESQMHQPLLPTAKIVTTISLNSYKAVELFFNVGECLGVQLLA